MQMTFPLHDIFSHSPSSFEHYIYLHDLLLKVGDLKRLLKFSANPLEYMYIYNEGKEQKHFCSMLLHTYVFKGMRWISNKHPNSKAKKSVILIINFFKSLYSKFFFKDFKRFFKNSFNTTQYNCNKTV